MLLQSCKIWQISIKTQNQIIIQSMTEARNDSNSSQHLYHFTVRQHGCEEFIHSKTNQSRQTNIKSWLDQQFHNYSQQYKLLIKKSSIGYTCFFRNEFELFLITRNLSFREQLLGSTTKNKQLKTKQ